MSKTSFILAGAALVTLSSCEPKPLDIEVKQKEKVLTISSAAPDEHTVIVSAAYSINSLLGLKDKEGSGFKLPKDMLLEGGLLTLATEGQQIPDTLAQVLPGIYTNRNLNLLHGRRYTLQVYDRSGDLLTMASTCYFSMPQPAAVSPEVDRKMQDPSVSLRIRMENVVPGDYYFVSYHTSGSTGKQHTVNSSEPLESLASYSPRQLILFNEADATNGRIERKVAIAAKGDDTLIVHAGKVDRTYFEYLKAYRKAGSFINQLTGEPINFPTNILKGLGCLSLSTHQRQVFYLREY